MGTENKTQIIGKVSATEKNPSNVNDFYFWTAAGFKLSPFDVIKVEHIEGSITYGIIDEINHVTDSASHFASFISSDFGKLTDETKGNTERLRFNYVKARVIGNTKNIYTPVLHDSPVKFCSSEDIRDALGLTGTKNPLTCGYLEMYGERVPVEINTNFLIGPDGAHLNISGISGLACKTSYCMFLMNALQKKFELMDDDDEFKKSIAFVIFNVKGKDLLSIDKPREYNNEKDREEDEKKYKILGLDQTPFSNVDYYYPYSDKADKHHLQSYATWDDIAKDQLEIKGNGHIFKYKYETCKDKLELLFNNEEGSMDTIDSILSYIKGEKGPFKKIKTWQSLIDAVTEMLSEDYKDERQRCGIQFSSWGRFKRLLLKKLSNKIFNDNIEETCHEVDLKEVVSSIKDNDVKVIDIANLDDASQGYVFGDVLKTLNDMMSSKDADNIPDKIIVFVDELNKYAGKEISKESPIKKELLDITERGRSLGLILFAVEQFESALEKRIVGNCSTNAYGRTNAVEISSSSTTFSHFSNVYKNLMTRLTPGEYIVSNPALRSQIKINFPRPAYKENN